jgi:hypothetical protein
MEPKNMTGSIGDDFLEFWKGRVDVAAAAVAAGVGGATAGMLLEMRQNVAAAGFGRRLPNALGARVYPEGRASLGAAGIVFARGSGASTIFEAFEEGAEITGKYGTWIAIPNKKSLPVLARGQRATPASIQAYYGRPLRYVAPRNVRPGGKVGLLVMDAVVQGRARGFKNATRRRLADGRTRASAVMFFLVPRATLRKRLDLSAIAEKWAGRTSDLIASQLPEGA